MSRVETVERCSQCGREKSADLPFCPWCGAANHPQEQGVCPKCQAAISPADEFCQQCGAPLRVPKAAVFAAETPATPTTAPKQSSRLVWALVIAGLVFLIFLLVYLSSNSQPEPVATPTPLSSAITSKGVIQVGKPAYADGRSLGGGPLATRMYIPVWEDAPGTIVKCHVHHGGSVSVAAVRWVEAEQQYYFRIEAEGCEGWVVELLIGDSAQPAVGERL
jgi:hypothetical protein